MPESSPNKPNSGPMPHAWKHINVTPDRVALVDPEDWEWLPKKGWALKIGRGGEYAMRRVSGGGKIRYIYLHRLVMHTPKGKECHHRNGYGLDCQKENLQNVSLAEHQDIKRINQIAKKKHHFA